MCREGVIKYQLEFTAASALPGSEVCELDAWRRVMHQMRLIGQDPARYEGYGFGNISRRVAPFYAPPRRRAFIISATQTGGLAALDAEHYTLVQVCEPARNYVEAKGPHEPSSEALTHAAVYAQDPVLRAVIHGHTPELWRHAHALGLPATHEDVPYGSPEMAREVDRLFRETDVRRHRLFTMGGHEDGVVAFGRTLEEAGSALLTNLARAFAVSSLSVNASSLSSRTSCKRRDSALSNDCRAPTSE